MQPAFPLGSIADGLLQRGPRPGRSQALLRPVARSHLARFGPGGKRVRKAVSGRTKTEVREKVRALREELDAGITPRA